MATTTVRVIELVRSYANPLIYNSVDLLHITFIYKGNEYKAVQLYEDVSTQAKLVTFIEKVIKKVPSLMSEQTTVNLTANAKGDYIVTDI